MGLERTGGFETVAFCEIEPFPRKVLAKHWPEVPQYDDVRTLTAERLAADGIAVDVICGGFPCQDISTAGKGAGLAGERSGLWSEIARLVGELRPAYVIVENVSALLGRGLGTVLADLAALRYDAEWHCIPASHVGAPHRRDRIWIVAYPTVMQCNGCHDNAGNGLESKSSTKLGNGGGAEALADTGHAGLLQRGFNGDDSSQGGQLRGVCGDVLSRREQSEVLADADEQGLQGRKWSGSPSPKGQPGGHAPECSCDVADPVSKRQQRSGASWDASNSTPLIQRKAIDAFNGRIGNEWAIEPDVGRVANGVPDRPHRLKGLGNAVVPQIPELIGRAILEARL